MKILDGKSDARAVAELGRHRSGTDPVLESRVREILDQVRADGDEALTTLTRQLDCRFIDSLGLRVPEREITRAYGSVSREFRSALRLATKNITRFHLKQLPRSWELRGDGMRLGQRFRPLDRVGIYIPGGKATYPSTVVMNAVPARIAGVKEIVMVTPCGADGRIAPEVLVAAAESGIHEIYRIGGAQAIAALAYGTESIRRVDKITGPGNAFVAAAKRLVFGTVGIDMIAGPTEVVIVADSTAQPSSIAADLIAQAEHDELASPMAIVDSRSLAETLVTMVETQLDGAPRKAIARKACDAQGTIIIAHRRKEAAAIVNQIAPEHVELIVRRPRELAAAITNAGSIFLGHWSTEALGDYVAGPNHTLPTSGAARFSSPLGVTDFMKFTNLIEVSRRRFERLAPAVELLAEAEGLYGHAASVKIRRRTT